MQDVQTVRRSHPPNPSAPRRAFPRARPQQARTRGGTNQASLEPLASIICERIGTLPPVNSDSYVESLSDARTPLADFINSLLAAGIGIVGELVFLIELECDLTLIGIEVK